MRFRTLVARTATTIALIMPAQGQAVFTTGSCLAAKLKAAGDLRKCQAYEDAKRLQSKTADPAKCMTKFQNRLVKLSEKASGAGIACHYGANGDGTVTDYDTQLRWEKKTGTDVTGYTECAVSLCSDIHDVANAYPWCIDVDHDFACDTAGNPPDGAAFTVFLPALNAAEFGGYSDWRLPTIEELQTIVDLTMGFCGGAPGACIDPIFGPTGQNSRYFSATSDPAFPANAWWLDFAGGDAGSGLKANARYVRAVRGGL